MKQERLDKLKVLCESCTNCSLYKTRKRMVFGEGSLDPKIMCIGEAPGRTENETGRPFIGRSGQLLRKLLTAIEINIETDVFISNILHCWPPNNRIPESEEIQSCIKFLQKQIEILQPKMLLFLGKTAVKGLLPDEYRYPMAVLRSNSKTGNYNYQNIPVFITYHPSALLMDPSKKVMVREDFLFLKEYISQK